MTIMPPVLPTSNTREPHFPAQRRQARPASSRHKGVLIAVIGLVSFLLAALLLAIGLAGYYWSSTALLPGISVAGTSLNGMDSNQAALAMNRDWNESRKISLTDGTQTWQTDPSFLGLWLDPSETAQAAHQIGRGPDGFYQVLSAAQGGRFEIAPVVRFDPQAARDQLSRWAELVDVPAVDAGLQLQDGVLTTTPAKVGFRMDVDRTLAGLAADPFSVMMSGEARVFFNPVPARVQDVGTAESRARELMGLKLGGFVYDPITDERIAWTVPPETVVGWVRIESGQDGYQVSLDQAGLVAYMAHLESVLDLGAGRTIVPVSDPSAAAEEMLRGESLLVLARHLPGEYVVEGGETLFQVGWKVGVPYWRMVKANPEVNPNALSAGQKLVVPSLDDLLPLPVVLDKRIVISISEQRMWVYQDGDQIREFIISTGIDRSPTQPGIFQVQTHELNAYAANWDLYMPHWMGIYEAWPGFMNGIHGLPMLSSGVRLWKNVLGSPASYGCIILDLPEAEWLYSWAENGVVVEIQR